MKDGFLYVGNNIFPTLLAISEEEQSKGLMYEKWEPPIMSFVYDSPKINKFWMKNTPSPLDIVFCLNGKISQICYGEPLSTNIIGSDEYSDLVVEFPHGTVDTVNIKVGQKIGLVKPTQDELRVIFAQKFNNYIKF